jgi:hypothetical protein
MRDCKLSVCEKEDIFGGVGDLVIKNWKSAREINKERKRKMFRCFSQNV